MTGAEIVAAAQAAAKVAEGVGEVAKQVKKWIEIDQNTRIRLLDDVVLGRFPETIAMPDGRELVVGVFKCADFEINADRSFVCFATGDREPFCDGASYCPDRVLTFDAARGAIGHDAIYQHLEEIARAWASLGWTEDDVRWLADGVFGKLWQAEAGRQPNRAMRALGHALAHVGYAAVRLLGGIYHRSRKGAVVLLAALALSGCLAIPDVFEPSDEQPRYESYTISPAAGRAPDGGQGSLPKTPAGESSSSASGCTSDAVDFAALSWSYGGFRGGAASLVPGCEISDLKVGSSGLSYKWRKGGCEALGATSRGDTDNTIACLFVQGRDGSWRGGKFDWISTSRTTRDFKNPKGGYHGWPTDAIETAAAYAFVIVSADGKRRTNVITAGR